jgi:hypothetical protein
VAFVIGGLCYWWPFCFCWLFLVFVFAFAIQHYVVKFVGGFLLVSSTNKTDRHGIAETLLKVTLSTMTLTLTPLFVFVFGCLFVFFIFLFFLFFFRLFVCLFVYCW